MRLALAMIYNLIILGTTVYLVGWQAWSAWWFLLAIILLATGNDPKPKERSFYD
jgi:hypothetical protein